MGLRGWAPVDAIQADRSPYGVIGMAGNVSEWTDSWDASKTYVVIRAGNYKSTSEQALADELDQGISAAGRGDAGVPDGGR